MLHASTIGPAHLELHFKTLRFWSASNSGNELVATQSNCSIRPSGVDPQLLTYSPRSRHVRRPCLAPFDSTAHRSMPKELLLPAWRVKGEDLELL